MVDAGDGHLVILFLIVSLSLGIVSRHLVLHYHVPLPYTVILLIAGLLLGLLTRIASGDEFIISEDIVSHMNPTSIAYIFLPALLFEGAFNVDYRTLSHLYLPVFLLAVPAVVLVSMMTSGVVYGIFDYNWDWFTALVLGAILSATDPVSVVANLKEMGASRRLSTIIEAESMLNDGVAYVLYTLFFDLLLSSSSKSLTDPQAGTSVNIGDEIAKFAQNSLGGPLWGLAFGIFTVTYLASIADFELEITLTVLSAYTCYYLAQAELSVSGVLAVVVFGLYLSKWKKNSVSPQVQSSLTQIWRFLSYISNTVIFVLTGIIVAESLFVNSSIRGVDFGFALDVIVILLLDQKSFRYIEMAVASCSFLMLGCFIYELSISPINWASVGLDYVPHTSLISQSDQLLSSVAIIGAVVMPHNLFLHSSIVQTRAYPRTKEGKAWAVKYATWDSCISLSLAFLMNSAILIISAAAFYNTPNQGLTDLNDAYTLLSPTLGNSAAGPLFGIALLASGQQSTLTGTLAGQIVMEGFVHIRIPAWLRRLLTRLLAVIPAVIITSIMGSAAVGKMLILSQIILSLQLTFSVVPLVQMTSQREKMAEQVNGWIIFILAILTTIVVAGLNIYLVIQFLMDPAAALS